MSEIDDTFLETYFIDRFLRPFGRRLQYIYTGFEHNEDIFVLSNIEDIDFKYCEPLQTTGLIKIHNQDHCNAVISWLTRFGAGRNEPRLVYFGNIVAALNKEMGTSTNITITTDPIGAVYVSLGVDKKILASRPIDTHFTLTQLQHYVEKYATVFFTDTMTKHDVTIPDAQKANKLVMLPISGEALYKAGVLESSCRDVTLCLRPGQDYLIIKSLLQAKTPYTSGIRLWADGSPHCINFGGFFNNPDISLSVVRDNIFVFPKVIDRSIS